MWFVVWRGKVCDTDSFEGAIETAEIFTRGEEKYNIALICNYNKKTDDIKLWAMRWIDAGAFELINIEI